MEIELGEMNSRFAKLYATRMEQKISQGSLLIELSF